MGVRSARNKRGRKPGKKRFPGKWAIYKCRHWPQEYKDLIDLLTLAHGHTRSRSRAINRLEREKREFITNAIREGFEYHRGLNYFYAGVKKRLDALYDMGVEKVGS